MKNWRARCSPTLLVLWAHQPNGDGEPARPLLPLHERTESRTSRSSGSYGRSSFTKRLGAERRKPAFSSGCLSIEARRPTSGSIGSSVILPSPCSCEPCLRRRLFWGSIRSFPDEGGNPWKAWALVGGLWWADRHGCHARRHPQTATVLDRTRQNRQTKERSSALNSRSQMPRM